MLRILLADDHPLVIDGARRFFSTDSTIEVCAVAQGGAEALGQSAIHRPDVVVFDLHMPDTDPVMLVRQLRAQNSAVELVLYSGAISEALVQPLLLAGVRSIISKGDDPSLLLKAVKAAGEHKAVFTPEIADIMSRRAAPRPIAEPLTPRQEEVVRLIAAGKSNKEIAAALHLSARTVEVHRAAIMRKLRVTKVAGVMRYAIRHGLTHS